MSFAVENSAYLKGLAAAVEAARNLTLPQPMSIQIPSLTEFNLAPEDCLKCVWDLEHAIYVIKSNTDPKKLRTQLLDFKASKQRACPKIHNHLSDTLYVGSSTTGIASRLKGHLGFGHPSTYALHLKFWFSDDISIEVYDLGKTDKKVVQLVEDAISFYLNPMFGKRGGNNK